MAKVALFRGRRVDLVNPSMPPCPNGRKPVGEISDRAKRYRANQAACAPSGPKTCAYCGKGSSILVNHKNGDESDGRRSNLEWACKSCNTKLGIAFKKAGAGVRTRQMNPKRKGPQFSQYVWAVSRICRKSDEAAGRCSKSNDPEVLEAVEIIRATPASVRRQYSAQARAGRRSGSRGYSVRDEVPF